MHIQMLYIHYMSVYSNRLSKERGKDIGIMSVTPALVLIAYLSI